MPESVRRGAPGPMVHRLPLEESLSAVPRLNRKTLGDKEESPFSFFPPTISCTVEDPSFHFSTFFFCFPIRDKSVFVMISHKVNAGTSCRDCGVVGSQPLLQD